MTTPSTSNNQLKALKERVSNSKDKLIIATVIGHIASMPFDVVAVRQQVGSQLNVIEMLMELWETGREYALWAGLIPSILISTIQLYTVDRFRNFFSKLLSPEVDDRSGEKPPVPKLRPPNAMVIDTISAGLAGMTTAFITMPLHTIKLALQLPTSVYNIDAYADAADLVNMWDAFMTVWGYAGWTSFYASLVPHLLGAFAYSSGLFAVYEKVKHIRLSLLAREERSNKRFFNRLKHRSVLLTQFLMSFLVGTAAGCIVSVPFDNIRVHGLVGSIRSRVFSQLDVVLALWSQDGVTSFFRGLPAKIIRSSVFACTSYLVTVFLDALSQNSDEEDD